MHPITKQLFQFSLGVIIWFLFGSAVGIGWRYMQRPAAAPPISAPQVTVPQPAASTEGVRKLV